MKFLLKFNIRILFVLFSIATLPAQNINTVEKKILKSIEQNNIEAIQFLKDVVILIVER